MFSITPTRPLATIAVLGGLLVAAAPAGAMAATSPKDSLSGQHVRHLTFSGDAYVNEMGLLPKVDDEVLPSEQQTKPHADGIIAILIGAIGTNDDQHGQNYEKLAGPAPLTAPLGSTKGSFIDASVIYGSDVRIPAGSPLLR